MNRSYRTPRKLPELAYQRVAVPSTQSSFPCTVRCAPGKSSEPHDCLDILNLLYPSPSSSLPQNATNSSKKTRPHNEPPPPPNSHASIRANPPRPLHLDRPSPRQASHRLRARYVIYTLSDPGVGGPPSLHHHHRHRHQLSIFLGAPSRKLHCGPNVKGSRYSRTLRHAAPLRAQ